MASEKKPKKGKDAGGDASGAVAKPTGESTTKAIPARFHGKYKNDVIPALTKQFSYTNPNQVPRLEKIVLNMGLGAAVTNPKIVDAAVEEVRAITGQKPVVTRAKKAIA